MFEQGYDQAHGLKQWFSPEPAGQVDLVSVNADDALCALARQIDQMFVTQGISARWQDPSGMLQRLGVPLGESGSADILISASRADRLAGAISQYSLGTVFAATPDTASLPALYSAIKETGERDEHSPLTVVWSGWLANAQHKQHLCEQNLANTVMRFLGRSLTFLRAPVGWANGASDFIDPCGTPPAFLAPLTDFLQAQVGQQMQRSPIFDN